MISERDCAYICNADFLPWEKLRGKTVLLTGVTGLIGRTLTDALLYANAKRELNLNVLALVRDEARARRQFAEHLASGGNLHFLEGTAEKLPELSSGETLYDVEEPIDYILHCAAQTDSGAFVRQPVETIKTAVQGTLSLLELARQKHVEGFVFLSSMEVYGHPSRGHKVVETDACTLRPDEVRGSYPVSKLQCESLCCAYASEYGVPAKIVRLTQTFGPGVRENDNRIFAEFGRCVRDVRDIVLRTKGETERSYLYTADAAAAILTVLLKGESGRAYNAADERTYCSVAQMAHKLADAYGLGVRFEEECGQSRGYGGLLYMDLDTSRLRALGWRAGSCGELDGDPLLYMYARMIEGGFRNMDDGGSKGQTGFGGKETDQGYFDSRKKVLLVSPFPVLRAGIQMFLLSLVRSLPKKDYSFTLCCTGIADDALAGEFEEAGVRIAAGAASGLDAGNGRQRAGLPFFRRLYVLCREEKFDIVHIHTSNLRFQTEALLAAKRAGIKCRIAHGHFAPVGENRLKCACFRFMIRHIATKIAACSGLAAKYMCGEKHMHEAVIFPNCIDAAHFAFSAERRAACREKLGLTDKLVLGHVGSFADYKNHDFLLEVFCAVAEKNHRARLLLVGEGGLLGQIKDKAASCGISDKVIFAGVSDRVNEYLCAMDVFVLPSHAEGLPLVCLEAQASGLRCMVSDTVAPEVKILEDFTFLPLKSGAEAWGERLLSTEQKEAKERANAWQTVQDAGRDIREVSGYAEKLYETDF